MDPSIVEYFHKADGPEGHNCGYCNSKDGSVSNGMWAHKLTCQDYQDLIDRGWRRSGHYCYKPCMEITCCPAYCIRCDVTNFKISKSQKSVAKKMTSFLLHGEKPKPEHKPDEKAGASQLSVDSHKTVRPGVGADPTKPRCCKAKDIRKELREKKKATSKQVSDSKSALPVESGTPAEKDPTSILEVDRHGKKPLEMFLTLPASDKPPAHCLELQLIESSPPSPKFRSTFKESFALYQKYQMAIHHDTEEKCSEKTFKRFLCDSPLIPMPGAKEWPCGYGSFHQHYRIDGKLIAVGVVDILPHCLSSVYLFYDPDFNFLSLGAYSALRELEMTRRLYLGEKALQFYYMGYYIHSCPKMSYKGQYSPSYLLCPISYKFMLIETCLGKIDAAKFARLNDEDTAPECVGEWLNGSLMLFQRHLTRYGIVKAILEGSDSKVTEYASLVGPLVSARMALFLQ